MSIDHRMHELEKYALKFWPDEMKSAVADQGFIVKLMETQDDFLSVLKIQGKSPFSFVNLVNESAKLTPNIFMKHLMILSDMGGEIFKRIGREFSSIFPMGSVEYSFNGVSEVYRFKTDGRGWCNAKFNVEKSLILKDCGEFSDAMLDAAFIMMWGHAFTSDGVLEDITSKGVLGSFAKNPDLLDKFVKERYIHVSRQTGGSLANDLGYLCEGHIKEFLRNRLDFDNKFEFSGRSLPGFSQNGDNDSKFDIVIRRKAQAGVSEMYFGIEVSFQVTTNSTIERKAGQAPDRRAIARRLGHKVCHIIDGSGNFERRNAVRTIVNHSDLVVNMSASGLERLAVFVEEVAEN